MTNLIRGYFDDSGTHAQSQMVVCGGVLASDVQHQLFKDDWNPILSRQSLPFFHFTKFKAHKLSPYSDMSEGEREILLMQLLLLIKVRIKFYFAAIMPVSVYENTLTAEEKERYGGAYSWVAQMTWLLIRNWAERNHYQEPIPFVVEVGTLGEDELGAAFKKVYANPTLKQMYRLHSLTSAGKIEFPGLQAADIVANSFFEIKSCEDAGRAFSKEVKQVADTLRAPYVEVRSLMFDAELLRSEADELNERYKEEIASGAGIAVARS